MTMQTAYFAMGEGGLDLTTPAIVKKQATAIAGNLYEARPEGYVRGKGYERYDGRPQPHEATYYILDFDAGVASISAGDTVTGATSGATGVAIADGVVESGTYGGGDAAGYLVLDNVAGAFEDDEDLQVSAATKCVADGAPQLDAAGTDALSKTYKQAAIEARRDAIGAVPGGGKLRGVWRYGGVAYAFRDDAASGATECRMYKSSSSGWTLVDLGKRIHFDAGTAAFQEGETLTGGTSGASATIERIITQAGSYSGNDAEGYLILSGVSGAFQDNETITGGTSSGSATSDGAVVDNALEPGGRFEFRNENFTGAAGSVKMYGVDGKSYGFEFDGSIFVPIITGIDADGAVTDAPIHIGAHQKHLWFVYAGGSLQHSGLGAPYDWTILAGASEIGFGDEITGLADKFRGVMVVYGRNKVAVLYGTSSSDWDLRVISDEAGADRWSVQALGDVVSCDVRGIRRFMAVESYGDFSAGTLSKPIEKLLRAKRNANLSVTASMRVRDRDQYRLFFSDGSGVCLDVSGGFKKAGFMPWSYDMPVEVAASCEDADGTEWLLFGSTDGYVYRADAGNSFDDADLEAFFRSAFNHLGSPQYDKRFFKATAEITAGQDASVNFTADFDYGAFQQSAADSFAVDGGGAFWGEANWDEFYWDSPVEGEGEAFIDGIGPNVSFAFSHTGRYEDPHTIHGLTLHYSMRRLRR